MVLPYGIAKGAYKAAYGMGKGAYNAGKSLADYIFPPDNMDSSKLESTINSIMEKDPAVRADIDRNTSRKRDLEYAILDTHRENRNLLKMAAYIDSIDKSLVPFDAVADVMKIFGGVGYGLSAGKELGEHVFKLPYIAYYTLRTGNVVQSIGNLLYEGMSWFIPGSLLDLTNRYIKQAQEYLEKTAAKKFLENGVQAAAKPQFVYDYSPATLHRNSNLFK